MKKVLLINEGGSSNLGDEAIRCALERLLKDANCDADWTRFAGWRGKTKISPTAGPKPVSKSFWKSLVKTVLHVKLRWLLRTWRTFLGYSRANEYDLIVIGGGQLIQSNEFFGLAMFIWVYLFKKFHKKKVVLIGVGAAESYTRFDRYLYGKSLKLVDDIYVRDSDSLSVLKNVFGVSAKLIPDVALYINKIYRCPPHKEKRALICPVSYEFQKAKKRNPNAGLDESEYLRYWEDLVLEYLRDGYQVKLFCTSKRPDLPTVQKLKHILDERGTDIELLDVCSLEELIGEIAKSEIIVSGRMHGLIIGYAYECKVIPYRTSEKIEAFEKEYISGDICLDEVQRRIVGTVEEIVGKA